MMRYRPDENCGGNDPAALAGREPLQDDRTGAGAEYGPQSKKNKGKPGEHAMTSPLPAEPNDSRPAILITGASGLLGTAAAKALAQDFDLVLFDIREPEEEVLRAEFIHCDLTEDQSVAQSMAQLRNRYGKRLASVIHLAAYYDFSGEPSPLYDALTVQGTRRLLAALRDFDVEQLIFSSSLLVMKPSEGGEPLVESSPTQAEWEYPQSKLATESIVEQERGDVPAVILRIAGVYTENCQSIPIAQQIRRICWAMGMLLQFSV